MSWQDLYTQSRKELGEEVKTKQDVYEVMVYAVRNKLNADPELKAIMLNFLTNGLDAYNSRDGYKNAVVPPVQFIQWLSQTKSKTITLQDIEPPNPPVRREGLTPEEAKSFVRMNSTGDSAQAILRSSLKGFTKYLISNYKIERNPFVGLKIEPTKSKRKIVFNLEQLDEFYNIVMFGAKQIYLLYWRVLLQTGLRPSHARILKLSDIDYNRPRNDAMDRKFYPVYALSALSREKKEVGEKVHKKNPAEIVYISEEMANDIKKWCTENQCPGGYIFKQAFAYVSFKGFIQDNRDSEKVKTKLKYNPEEYIPYGLRDSWASTLYNISLNMKDLTDLGGWDEETTALKYYVNAFRATEALDIAKKWGIFIPPERADEVKRIEMMKAAPTQPEIQRDEVIKTLQAQIETLMKQMAEWEKRYGGVKEPYPVYS